MAQDNRPEIEVQCIITKSYTSTTSKQNEQEQLAVLQKQTLIEAQASVEKFGCEVFFARYPDGTLQLFKPGSILSETPAGYSEERVAVKALVKSSGEKFMVIIPTTRIWLDSPGAEEKLHRIASEWKS